MRSTLNIQPPDADSGARPDGSSSGEGGADSGVVAPATPMFCGKPLPTTAPSPLALTGTIKPLQVGMGAQGNVSVAAIPVGATAAIATAAASGAGLTFALSVPSGGAPANIFLAVTSSDANWVPTHVYRSTPFAKAEALSLTLWRGDGLYGNFFVGSGVTKQVAQATVYAVVRDCQGKPVAGAVVTSSGGGTVRYTADFYSNPNLVATAANGIAYILNVPPGAAQVGGTVAAKPLRAVKFAALADTVADVLLIAE